MFRIILVARYSVLATCECPYRDASLQLDRTRKTFGEAVRDTLTSYVHLADELCLLPINSRNTSWNHLADDLMHREHHLHPKG